ncbi:MAG TPA: hypothetical protein VFP60_16750 [Pseudolabrys sp.]|nr:hypothetical protein [Pseudolabrys sp.]
MADSSGRLPTRFPEGTKFVIEGKPGRQGQLRIYSRYLEFPDGTFLRLPIKTRKRNVSARARIIRKPLLRGH